MKVETEEYLRKYLGYNDQTIQLIKLVQQKMARLDQETS